MHSPDEERRRYWRFNIGFILLLLAIWFGVAFGLSILGADLLNRIHLAGFPLGFWFAQQGSIYVFIGLIFLYAVVMDREDRKYHVEEREVPQATTDEEDQR